MDLIDIRFNLCRKAAWRDSLGDEPKLASSSACLKMFTLKHVRTEISHTRTRSLGFPASSHHLFCLNFRARFLFRSIKTQEFITSSDDTGSCSRGAAEYCRIHGAEPPLRLDGNDLHCGTGSKDEEMVLRRSGNA